MLRIIISGCNGHMGRVVESLCNADPEVQVAAGFDVLGSAGREFPVYSSPAQFTGEADAVIDFSSPAALEGLLATPRSRWPRLEPPPWRCPFSAPPICLWASTCCWSW